MKKKKFLLMAGSAGLAVCAAVGMTFRKPQEPDVPVPLSRTVKLHRVASAQAEPQTVSYPGRIKARNHADLFFRVSGPVMENDLELGMNIEKGRMLMRLDPRDYEREVERLTHHIAVLNSQFVYKEQEYRRMKRLFQNNAVSKANYELSLSVRDAAAAEIREQETALKTARDKLADTRLAAPFSGRITDLKIEKHEMAKANEAVLSLQSLDELEITVNVPEGNIPQMPQLGTGRFLGKTFPVYFPGRNFRHQAVLEEFRPVTSEENGTYELRFSMKQPEHCMVFPGMTVEVLNLPTLQSRESRKTRIPFSALFRKDGGVFVWEYLPDTKRLMRRAVKPGRIQGKSVEVESLPDGTLIVAAGGSWLSESHQITLLNPEVLHAAH